jgi:hypothetical protein
VSVIRTTRFQANSSARERTMASTPTTPRIMEPVEEGGGAEELEPKIVDGEG